MTAAQHVELMAHQSEGVEFLTQRRAGLLAFEQGLGKTLVAIEAFRRVWWEGHATRLLVICPNSLKRNWVAEIARFAPDLDAVIVEGPPRERRRLFAETTAPILITSCETARTEVTAVLALLRRHKTALVLDESHATKNWRSLTSTAARHFAPHSGYRWLLSGTPVTNSPAMTNSSVDFAREPLSRLIMRRTKEQCLDLPEKSFADIRVELPAWQRRLYDDMRSQMVCTLEAMSGEEYRAFASTALAQLTRLSQIASNPALLFPHIDRTPGKFEELDAIVQDILAQPSRKIIIWSNYVLSIESLLKRYADYGAVALYGGTPGAQRQHIASRFQNDSAIRVLIGNPAAAGTGFTLTAASFTVYETLSWRYDFYAQSQDRNHRIGQSLPVTYLRLIAADTIEEAIITALERKTAMARNLLGDENHPSAISQLTREQMCHLLLHNELPDA